MKFRYLKPEEVEIRAQKLFESYTTFLLYKDARCDMNILDETVSSENWQRDHFECKGNLFCKVGIKENSEWIWKADCGTESNSDAEKGESSDSFKRACVCWGIGRELYTAPKISISNNLLSIGERNGKKYVKSSLRVSKFEVVDGKITELTILNNDTGNAVFNYTRNKTNSENKKLVTPKQAEILKKILSDEQITRLFDKYKINDIQDLDRQVASDIISKVKK